MIHCPYCHGWEVSDKTVGVLATTWFAVQKALLVRQWVDDLTLLLHTQPEPDEAQLEQLAARDIRVVRGEVVGEFIAADPTGLTAEPGVWVAGNVADIMADVERAVDERRMSVAITAGHN